MARTLALAVLALLVCSASALARPGDVDTSFGDGGQALVAPELSADSRGLAVQQDGKLLVSGNGGRVGSGAMLLRLEADGRLDREFGAAGQVTTPLRFTAADPLVMPDGRIVVFGDVSTGQYGQRAAAVRLLPDGSVDPSFGDGGLAVVPGGSQSDGQGGFALADGRLVLLGHVWYGSPPSNDSGGAAAVRLTPDGRVDTGFGGDDGWARVVVPASSGLVYQGFEQADGRLVVAGEFVRDGESGNNFAATLVRMNADGSRDESYGQGGVAQGFFTAQGGVFGGIARQADGKVLLVGGTPADGGGYAFAVARANPDGSPDAGFGTSGRVVVRPPGSGTGPLVSAADAAVVQSDGSVVVSGNTSPPAAVPQLVSAWAVTRLLPDGRVDGGFGDAGWSIMASAAAAGGGGSRLWPSGLVRTAEGKVVISGDATDCGHGAIALVRLHAGNPDSGAARGPAMRTCDPVVEADPDGDLPLEVQCPRTEDVCRGSARITIASNGMRVGARSFKLRGAQTGTVTIRASDRTRRYIARPRGVRAEVAYTTKDGDGHRRVTRRKLRLKRGR